MKNRVREENRYTFTLEEKQKMLERSNGVCAHCGKVLKVGNKDCTAEHVIPLSKGGRNDLSNLVCLCKDCNYDKSNLVAPVKWYKYIKESEVPSLNRLMKRYYKDYCHISQNNFYHDDIIIISEEINIQTAERCGGKPIFVKTNFMIKKANKNRDLDILVDAYVRYNKRLGITCDLKFITCTVKLYLDKGAIYYCVDKGGNIRFVIPVMFRSVDIETEFRKELTGSSKSNLVHNELAFHNIISCSKKDYIYAVMCKFIKELIEAVSLTFDLSTLPVWIDGYNDGAITDVFELVFKKVSIEGGMMILKLLTYSSDSEVGNGMNDYFKTLKLFSKALDEYNIKPVSQKSIDEYYKSLGCNY